MDKIRIAIDGNEANVTNRVGSNVYAFGLLKALKPLIDNSSRYSATVFLRQPPRPELPKPSPNWQYQLLPARGFWVYWAFPRYLFAHANEFDVLYSPGHYLPLISPIPTVVSIMDLGFHHYPSNFTFADWLKLSIGTKRSVQQAQRIVAISHFTRSELMQHYHCGSERILVAPPAPPKKLELTTDQLTQILRPFKLNQPFFLYLGTLQPRKNILNLVKAYEIYAKNFQPSKQLPELPKLVLAGKVGWLAQPILAAIENSPYQKEIVRLGFVTDQQKAALLTRALSSISISQYEGFGIPALEALQYGTVPIVANTAGLPEAVGQAGFHVSPYSPVKIANQLDHVTRLNYLERLQLRKKARAQVKQYSWEDSAQVALKAIRQASKHAK